RPWARRVSGAAAPPLEFGRLRGWSRRGGKSRYASLRTSLGSRGRIRVCNRACALYQIFVRDTLHVVRGDLVVGIEISKQLAPIAEVGFVGAQLRSQAAVAIELANQSGAELGLDALNGSVVDLLLLHSVDDLVNRFLILLDGVAGSRDAE